MPRIVITVIVCVQTGPDTYQDSKKSKIFIGSATLTEMDIWIKSIDTSQGFDTAQIALLVD